MIYWLPPVGDQPTSETTLNDYPTMLAPVDHTEPVPRRVRGYLGGRLVFDTQEALYVWEWPSYPQFYIPATDVEAGLIVDEQTVKRVRQGTARVYGLRVPQVTHTGCAMLFADGSLEGLSGRVRFDWDAVDSWFEEDEKSSSTRAIPTPGWTR